MGYTTEFNGSFRFNKPLDAETHKLLTGLATTRRMARKGLGAEYGTEGEFFVNGAGFMGQGEDKTVIDHNRPPKTQPSLWLQWIPNDDGTELAWDGNEKFYSYVNWLEYLIDKILAPRGYSISGEVTYQGEDSEDFGKIVANDNDISVLKGSKIYS